MRKEQYILRFCLLIVLLYGSFTEGLANITNPSENEFCKKLHKEIPKLMARYKIPGAIVAVIENGEVAFTNAYGYANVETGRRMSTADYCRVESISKSVTAWGVMKLVEQGKLKLDATVAEYLKSWEFPESEFLATKITVRQLLNHTSGLPLGPIDVRYAPTENMPTLIESLTQNALPNRDPGLRFEYANVGYHILELLIEEVTDMSFPQYMEQNILLPLGMKHSSFEWHSDYSDIIPNGYDFNGNPIPPYVYPEKAAGGLIATVDDIAKFVCAGMPSFKTYGNAISHESILQLYAPSVSKLGFYGFAFNSYGFGHLLEKLSNGKLAVAHGGQGAGWMTHYHAIPETGHGIVILTNSQRSWPFFARVLTRWAQWAGVDRVGMSIIYTGEKILWVAMSLLILFVSWSAIQVGLGICQSTRNFAPFSKRKHKSRIVLTLFLVFIFAIYIWAVSQDYIFFTSIFPGIAGWLVYAIPVLALSLLIFVLFPKNGHTSNEPALFIKKTL